jgi:ABC-type nitrate/sulfonate/bicarbonate transport system substrate-binding protein
MLAKSAQIKERAYVRAHSPSRQPQFLSYESMTAKILATFICLYLTLIGRTDVGAAVAKPRVVIAHAAMNFRVAPLWVAQDQGFFSKYGIDSEVIYMRGVVVRDVVG